MLVSTERFWGWSENKREEERDFEELSQRAREGKPLYGESDQPADIQGVAHRNSAWAALKFRAFVSYSREILLCFTNVLSHHRRHSNVRSDLFLGTNV